MLCGVKSIGSSIRRSGWEMGVTIFISLDCCKINDIFYVKYLTSCLTWRSHITKKIKDVKKKIFFFCWLDCKFIIRPKPVTLQGFLQNELLLNCSSSVLDLRTCRVFFFPLNSF